jgi:hypothetical protein
METGNFKGKMERPKGPTIPMINERFLEFHASRFNLL